MATVFVSHSSKDDKLASQLEDWMKTNGFSDLFIDHSNIRGGDKWADALREAAGACKLVVLLVTPNWLASTECPSEFKAAWYMGKRILPLFLLPPTNTLPETSQSNLQRIMAESQGIDLSTLFEGEEGGLNFAKNETTSDQIKQALIAAGALKDVGLSPDVFEINRQTHELPFPGLRSFGDDDADAALFYGRSREIGEALEALRQMRASNKEKSLVILGASGSGKSSLLKAGLIPRLRREAPAWVPLRVFRPGADPLLNFADSITRSLAEFDETSQAKGHLKQDLLSTWASADKQNGELTPEGLQSLHTKLDEIANRLRTASNRPQATLLIGVDQAEELARADDESGQALADYLRIAMNDPKVWRLAFTIRTDSFPELQSHPRFRDMESWGYDLRSLPIFKFDDVVEKPAQRYGVHVDHDLIDALMEDAPQKDALPLLAFAIQRLWDQYAGGDDQTLSLKNYNDMGRLTGLIDGAAERALCGFEPDQFDAPLPKSGPSKSQLNLGGRTFVPALVDVNEDGAAIRRVADWSEFDDDQKDLLDRFDRWRLLIKKSETGQTKIEVAHEALFREWGTLKNWLEPEKGRLEVLRGIKSASAAWDRKGKDDGLLTHMGERLTAAKELQGLARYQDQMEDVETTYVAACLKQEKVAKGRSNRMKALAFTGIAGVALAGAYIPFKQPIDLAFEKRFLYRKLSDEKLSDLKAGESFKECRGHITCPEMVVVPTGTFLMGSEDGENNEQPVREVSVQRFAVGKFEVTNNEWSECVKHTSLDRQSKARTNKGRELIVGCAQSDDAGLGYGDRPVKNVSWHDAKGYVAWLNVMVSGDAVSGPYRLLSESEWEYAARAETATKYFWGDEIGKNNANCSWNGCRDEFEYTSRVGSFEANAFGLHDMHGNVMEWVEDCYGINYSQGQPVDGSPFINCSSSYDRVSGVGRGGDWNSNPRFLRSADRSRYYPTYRGSNIGFRIARTLP